MKGHIHVGALQALVIFAWVLLIGLGWKETTHRLVASDGQIRNNIGQGMAYIYA